MSHPAKSGELGRRARALLRALPAPEAEDLVARPLAPRPAVIHAARDWAE